MFQQLPLEIILNICTHLTFENKLNLKLTCHKLNDLFTNAILYETLDLVQPKYKAEIDRDNDDDRDERDRPYDAIIRRLANSQFDGSLVRELRLDTEGLSDKEFSLLSDLFPNLTRLIVPKKERSGYGRNNDDDDDDIRYDFFDIVNPLPNWRNTIKTIISLHDWSIIVKDVFSSTYSQLTTLDLHNVHDKLKKSIGNDDASFFHNAPLLDTLTLRDAIINLDILEAIHAGFPLIRTLKLIDPVVEMKEDTALPTTIVPANLLIHLAILNASGITKQGMILNYIPNKYPNLEHLSFGIERSDDYTIRLPGEPRAKKLFYPISDSDSDSDIDSFSYNNSNSEDKDKDKDDEKENAIIASRRAIEANFFSSLPNSLKTLTLDMNNIDNAVAALAESDTNIKTLDLIQAQVEKKRGFLYSIGFEKSRNKIWRDPTLLEHVKKLTSLKTLKVAFGSSILSFNQGFISSTVTRLTLGIDGKLFCFDWILAMFPSLEELHINPPRCNTMDLKECDLEVQQDDAIRDGNTKEARSKKQYPKLRALSIKACRIQPEVFDFIKFAAPNLDELNLTLDNTSSGSSNTTLKYDLSNWSLNRCNILANSYQYHFYCIVTIRNVSKRCVFKDLEHCLVPVEQHYKEPGGRKWIEIISDDIKDLNILGYSIVKVGEKLIVLL